MSKPTIKIGYEKGGHWAKFVTTPLITKAFPECSIVENNEDPSVIIRSHFATGFPEIDGDKPYISWSGEYYHVAPRSYDPVLELNSFYSNHANSFYLPQAVFAFEDGTSMEDMVLRSPSFEREYNSVFCFRHEVPKRNEFFRALRAIDPKTESISRCENTTSRFKMTSDWHDVFNYFSEFKMSISMENSYIPGYITEKPIMGWKAGCVPIYWGSSGHFERMFNTSRFISIDDFPSLEKAAEHCLGVCEDPHKYQKYLNGPIWAEGKVHESFLFGAEVEPAWVGKVITLLRDAIEIPE
jgi:hypothetical protein